MEPSVYCRASKPKHIVVKPAKDRKPSLDSDITISKFKPIKIHKSSECHVTPKNVSARMIEALGITKGELLEPQGGTGNLVFAAISTNWDQHTITVIEQNYDLVSFMRERFCDTNLQVLHSCFIDYAASTQKRFDGIICNPPFKTAKRHIQHALSVLKEGGVIVALVPITFDMPGFELVEELPIDTFEHAKVRTKIVKKTV